MIENKTANQEMEETIATRRKSDRAADLEETILKVQMMMAPAAVGGHKMMDQKARANVEGRSTGQVHTIDGGTTGCS